MIFRSHMDGDVTMVLAKRWCEGPARSEVKLQCLGIDSLLRSFRIGAPISLGTLHCPYAQPMPHFWFWRCMLFLLSLFFFFFRKWHGHSKSQTRRGDKQHGCALSCPLQKKFILVAAVFMQVVANKWCCRFSLPLSLLK